MVPYYKLVKYYKDLTFLYGISFIVSARGKLVDYSLYWSYLDKEIPVSQFLPVRQNTFWIITYHCLFGSAKGEKIYIYSRFIIKVAGTGGMWIKLLRIYLYDSGLFDNRIISFSEQKECIS